VKEWSDDFIRHMIAKGSTTPPLPGERRTPRWYWLTVMFVTLAGIGVAFCYGVYGL
jgi:hypothetical protein